jgi:hypothetical protein
MTKQPNLKLNTRPKQLLGYILLAFKLANCTQAFLLAHMHSHLNLFHTVPTIQSTKSTKLYKSTNLQIYKSTNLQIYKSTNLQIYKSTNLQKNLQKYNLLSTREH